MTKRRPSARAGSVKGGSDGSNAAGSSLARPGSSAPGSAFFKDQTPRHLDARTPPPTSPRGAGGGDSHRPTCPTDEGRPETRRDSHQVPEESSARHFQHSEGRGRTGAPRTRDKLGRAPRLARRALTAEVTPASCAAATNLEPRSLGITYWFTAAPVGEPYAVNVMLEGHRQDAAISDSAHFVQVATVDPVVPGSGLVSLTHRVAGVESGTWTIKATPVRPSRKAGEWEAVRSELLPQSRFYGAPMYEPLNRVLAPGVRLGAWPALVASGAALGLIAQGLLATRMELPPVTVTLISVLACLVGLLGARTYYLLTHPVDGRRPLTAGMSIQGFVLATVGTLVLGSWVVSMPLGILLDASAPGLLLGMAVGRLGCLLGGCCVGKITSSRWGVWSSNRRVGARRTPVQLLESAVALAMGIAATVAVWTPGVAGAGWVFLASVPAYTATRQLLFPLREIPRATKYGRGATFSAAVAVSVWGLSGLILR